MRKPMRQLVRKSGSLVMAAALAVGMTACSSQNNSQTTALLKAQQRVMQKRLMQKRLMQKPGMRIS